jgi:hypothetical protein
MMSNKICIVGWHFFDKFYKKIEKSSVDTHIVAHRYNSILDRRNLNYSVVQNVGLEFGAYDWYIKNVWDKKSGVLFMHDDVFIEKTFDLNNFFKLCGDADYVMFRNGSKVSGGGRCIYLSGKMISLLVKKYDGIWFDKNDRGYIWGEQGFYDEIYYELGEKKIWKDHIGINFKLTTKHLIEKYKLKKKDVISDKISLGVRGKKSGKYSKMLKDDCNRLSDNSLFGSSEGASIESQFEGDISERTIEGYLKWYNFYFSKLKYEALNILEVGSTDEHFLSLWKNYFVNSNVFSLRKDEIEGEYHKIPYGADIIIDTGHYDGNRIAIFESLFKQMSPGGIYIIENLRRQNEVVDYFKEKVNDINFNGSYSGKSYEDIIYEKNDKIGFFEKRIASIHFYMGMCFVFKRYCK